MANCWGWIEESHNLREAALPSVATAVDASVLANGNMMFYSGFLQSQTLLLANYYDDVTLILA